MAFSSLTVVAHPVTNTLVVDSRLIAESMGIQHKTFARTIERYKESVESNFGRLIGEDADAETPTGGQCKRFSHYLLNEDQATFLMTLSRNTPQVIQCKLNLVKAFSDAKKLIESLIQTQPQKAPAKILNRNYSSARKECCDQLKRHGATGKTYGAVEKYNNELSGIESGSRHELTYEQAHQVGNNYLFAAIELLKRDAGFNNGNQYHLAATTKMGMRHGMYEQLGADSVPEKLKPKKERKQLKAS